jgi:pyroglutamyl-peptidase
VAGGPPALPFPALARRLALAGRAARTPTALSRNAGRYLCNYLCWRALEAAAKPGGPQVVAFIHVPKLRAVTLRRRAPQRALGMKEAVRAGEAMLLALVAAARARRHMAKR